MSNWGCEICRRRFWPTTTQEGKPVVPIHDWAGGICDGALTATVELTRWRDYDSESREWVWHG